MNELYHHGIKGQKWGIRRFQNRDGTLTQEGRKRLGINNEGRLSFVTEKASREANIKFAVKTGVKAAAIAGTAALATWITKNPQFIINGITSFAARVLINNPEIIQTGMTAVSKLLSSDRSLVQATMPAAEFIANNPQLIKAGIQSLGGGEINLDANTMRIANQVIREVQNNPEIIEVVNGYLNSK